VFMSLHPLLFWDGRNV